MDRTQPTVGRVVHIYPADALKQDPIPAMVNRVLAHDDDRYPYQVSVETSFPEAHGAGMIHPGSHLIVPICEEGDEVPAEGWHARWPVVVRSSPHTLQPPKQPEKGKNAKPSEKPAEPETSHPEKAAPHA